MTTAFQLFNATVRSEVLLQSEIDVRRSAKRTETKTNPAHRELVEPSWRIGIRMATTNQNTGS